MASQVEEIDSQALYDLIARIEHAIEHELALEPEDLRLLLNAIHTLMTLQSRLEDKDVTLHKLRKLLGMVSSSEKRTTASKASNRSKNETSSDKKTKSRKKRTPPKTEHHVLEGIKRGDPCPACPNGTLVKCAPAVLIRVSGSAPLEAVKHIAEQLTCRLCDYRVSATLPESITNDGGAQQQYGYSARSVMSIHKHFSGLPYYHQETLNDLFGCPVTASTIFDQCEYVANDVMACFHEMQRQAANATLLYIDDTHNRILDQQPEERPKRNGKGTQQRSGVFTSGLIAVTPSGERIYLYNTNLGHAGEFLDEILRKRDTSLPPPIIMSDALNRNKPTVMTNAIIALCNAHGRRQFVDIEQHFPDEVKWVLDRYGQIWANEKTSKKRGDDAQQRLDYHKEHSLPIMETIHVWCKAWFDSPIAEEHSGLGKACKYFLNHYDGLMQFTRTAGAPIDNNLMEAGLKTSIRTRKNSHFYKTQTGADVANVLTSVITSAYRNDVNPFDYLNAVQRNVTETKENPTTWLPWNARLAS